MLNLYDDAITILLYHGVTNHISFGIENNHKKHIQEDIFKRQMEFVKQTSNILSVDDLLDFSSEQKILGKNVIITFDDGFENNYSVAAPILDSLGIPAVFYVSAGIVDTNLMFWVDVLEDCINLTDKQNIEIIMAERLYVFDMTTFESKLNALNIIKGYCKRCVANEKDNIMQQVQEETRIVSKISHSPNYRKITWKQIKELNSNKLFTIGGHGMYHNILSKLDSKRLIEEISLSLGLLEYHLGEKVKHYSYPEGLEEHFNQKVIDQLISSGVRCCPTAMPGPNSSIKDLFRLRRNMV